MRSAKLGLAALLVGAVLVPSAGLAVAGPPDHADTNARDVVRVDANPEEGWGFNQEMPFVTPAAFTTEAARLGRGSIGVEPITNLGGSVPDAKFILRHVPEEALPVADVEGFWIDFLIHPDSPASAVSQFYVNYYTLTPDPTDGSWYDCRFDYVATGGSSTGWAPVGFEASDTATHVADQLGGACPAAPAGMPEGSTVLFVSVNLGDTSSSDAGAGGYYDNARLTVSGDTTVWDFEAPRGRASDGPRKVWLCHFDDGHAPVTPYPFDGNGADPGFWTTPEGEHLTGDYVVRYNSQSHPGIPAGLNPGQVNLCEARMGGEFQLVSVNALGSDQSGTGHRAQNLARVGTYPDGWKG